MTLGFQAAKKQWARFAATGRSPAAPALKTPEQLAHNSRLEQVVLGLRHDTCPINTIKALDAKQEECTQCCDKVHGNDDYKCTLDSEKACAFVFCVAFREQKPRGGYKKTLYQNIFFDHGSFLAVKAQVTGLALEVEQKKNVGKSVFLQHKAMLRKLYKE